MIYYRRKILLSLLEINDGKLTAKRIQKFLFLISQEQKEKSYYFIPYKYGCFSYQAEQDIKTLEKYGVIKILESLSGRTIELNESEKYFPKLKINDKIILNKIKKQFTGFSQNELIKYTYINYPYYSINSTILDKILNKKEKELVLNEKINKSGKTIFSIGYEGISLEEYLNLLIKNDVKVLCDVRKNAFSQKYGFSKSQLKVACDGLNIQYIHISNLGISSNKRKELNCQHDYDELFEEYENETLRNQTDSLIFIQQLVRQSHRVAITCFEKNTNQCHRTRVLKALLNLPNANYNYIEF